MNGFKGATQVELNSKLLDGNAVSYLTQDNGRQMSNDKRSVLAFYSQNSGHVGKTCGIVEISQTPIDTVGTGGVWHASSSDG